MSAVVHINASEPHFMTNVYGRGHVLLNGRWSAFTDLYDQGRKMEVYKNRKPLSNEEFYEYSFDGAMRLDVPGDWNSQYPELKYYEGTMWYARHFDAPSGLSAVKDGKAGGPGRIFLYFGAVSYRCRVYLNGEFLTSHEGGFTPFQAEVTGLLKDKDNFLCIEVSNRRTADAIPAMNFDWWNYGGITRDVMLVSVPEVFVDDYFIRLDKHEPDLVHVSVSLSAPVSQDIIVEIPELKARHTFTSDKDGKVSASFKVKKLCRWAPDAPKLYEVAVRSGTDEVHEEIGFRNIEVRGTQIFVNGVPTFMRSISFHEEIPQRQGRAFSQADASMLLSEASALGVNMIRLAHYPQNEYTVRLAEKMGIILWEEIPVWQGINFSDAGTREKAKGMLTEMINRDKNRCAVGYWGVANETKPSPERNDFLMSLLETGRAIDTTRLYVAAFDLAYFEESTGHFEMHDDFTSNLDVVAVNKYMGWYHPWPVAPSEAVWDVAAGQPLIISEFGGEALYGQSGSDEAASSWSEDYQARLYRDNLEMFGHIPNLAGVSPWVLFDFRSPYRFHPANQEGWNRKGLVSDQGQRKKAWYIMEQWYSSRR
ncbi:MAG: glycoside hydrolase family 2 [Bacteroides sp.]|nr:glycoside hydrolase family 2 [Bacteroides sp.]